MYTICCFSYHQNKNNKYHLINRYNCRLFHNLENGYNAFWNETVHMSLVAVFRCGWGFRKRHMSTDLAGKNI